MVIVCHSQGNSPGYLLKNIASPVLLASSHTVLILIIKLNECLHRKIERIENMEK